MTHPTDIRHNRPGELLIGYRGLDYRIFQAEPGDDYEIEVMASHGWSHVVTVPYQSQAIRAMERHGDVFLAATEPTKGAA